MRLNIAEMRQQIGEMVVELRKKQDECDERGGMTAEERQWFEDLNKKISDLEIRKNQEEALQAREAESAKTADELARTQQQKSNGYDDVRYGMSNSRRSFTPLEFEQRISVAFQGWMRMAKPQGVLEQHHIDAAKSLGIADLRAATIDLPIIRDYRSFQKEYRVGLDTITSSGRQRNDTAGICLCA